MTSADVTPDELWSAIRQFLLVRLLRSARPSAEGMGNDSIDLPGSAYVQWTRVARDASPIHIEISVGTFPHPMREDLVDLLSQLGWSAPDAQFPNPWMRSSERPLSDDLAQIADTVILTAAVGLGLSLDEIGMAVVRR